MVKKNTNKKDNKKDDIPEKPSFSVARFLFFSLSILTGTVTLYVYNLMTRPPSLPKLDMEQWWGPYPISPNPDISIRPYQIEFSDVMINDLKERLLHRRPFTPPLEDAGFSYGFNSNFLTQVLDYWQNKYNFKERERFFNKYNHFITNVQGLDIHFIHVKPNVDSKSAVVPILMLHGWPGSVREFYDIIPLLTTPRPAHKFVFEVIVPSLPGYGFSQAAVRPGLGPLEIGIVMKNLMKRIGHEHFYIQGGDWGHAIGSAMATMFPETVLGFHTNMPVISKNTMANIYYILGDWWPSAVIQPELQRRMYPASAYISRLLEESGYMHIHATKPDTVGIALTDSPAGLAAYILEKFSTWTNNGNKRAADGNLLAKFSLTHLLDNIMVYWSTNCITTSIRLYAETLNKRYIDYSVDEIPTEVPTWGIKFKHEIMFSPDSFLRLKYKNYLQSTIAEDGGHFAAFENPRILAHDIFEAVDTFRQFHAGRLKTQETSPVNHETAKTIYDFTVKDINGKDVKLDKYKGHVSIIVNVASQCGLTDTNYKQLNELYEKYEKTRGLRILAFPCNQFGNQEPGSQSEILKFTKERGIKFDLFEKIEVNGENTHPLWKFLKQTQSGTLGDFIKWNFSKFIIDKNGVPVERLAPTVDPLDMEPLLAKYW